VIGTAHDTSTARRPYLDTKDALVELKLPWLGLQPAETYEQLIDSLLQLDGAFEDILGRVERRVARERATLQGLEARIESAAQRSRGIAGSSAATVVFSSARYPAPKSLPPFERLFYDAEKLAVRAERAIEVPEEAPVESFAAMAERRRALDRVLKADAGLRGQQPAQGVANGAGAPRTALAEYEAELALRPELASNSPALAETPEKLAPIPPFVTSSASSVLFNARRDAFADHSPLDNLSGENLVRRDDERVDDEVHEAPQTVRLGDELPEVERIEYSYKPILGDVPDINVPTTLPNLANGARDRVR
jgi:WAS family protein 1